MSSNNLKKSFFEVKNINVSEEKSENKKNNEYIENYTKTILTIIGCNIRTMRKLKKYTIMELADMSKLSTKYLQAVENGKRNISITKIYSIAKAMEVPITMFFSDIDLDKTKKVFEMFNRLKKL